MYKILASSRTDDFVMANSTGKKTRPVSFAARTLILGPKRSTTAPAVSSAEPLWTGKEIGIYLDKEKTALNEFLNRSADFPALKIGTEWRRADPKPEKTCVTV